VLGLNGWVLENGSQAVMSIACATSGVFNVKVAAWYRVRASQYSFYSVRLQFYECFAEREDKPSIFLR